MALVVLYVFSGLVRMLLTKRANDLIEQFCDLLGRTFDVPVDGVKRFRQLGYEVDNLYSVSETRLSSGIPLECASQIVVVAITYVDRPGSDRLVPYC